MSYWTKRNASHFLVVFDFRYQCLSTAFIDHGLGKRIYLQELYLNNKLNLHTIIRLDLNSLMLSHDGLCDWHKAIVQL